MHNDFEKERKMKKKFANDMSKNCKKYFETKHIENEKTIRKRELDLIKKSNFSIFNKYIDFSFEYVICLSYRNNKNKENAI